jgi:hypothetical protein
MSMFLISADWRHGSGKPSAGAPPEKDDLDGLD